MIDPVVHITLRVGLALLFAAAAFHKWSDRERFAATLQQYRLLPEWSVRVFATLLMLLEAGLAIALLLPSLCHTASFIAGCLLGIYSAAIAVNLLQGRFEIDCGCLGPNARVSLSWWLVARNGLLLLIAVAIWLPQSGRTLHWLDGLTVLFATATSVFLWAAAHNLPQTRLARRRHA